MAEVKRFVYSLQVTTIILCWMCLEILLFYRSGYSTTVYMQIFRTSKAVIIASLCILYYMPKFDSVQMYRNLNWLTRTNSEEGLWAILLLPDVMTNIWLHANLSENESNYTQVGYLFMLSISMGSIMVIVSTMFIGYHYGRHRLYHIIIYVIVPTITILTWIILSFIALANSKATESTAVIVIVQIMPQYIAASYLSHVVGVAALCRGLRVFQRHFSLGECATLSQALALSTAAILMHYYTGEVPQPPLDDSSVISLILLCTGCMLVLVTSACGDSVTSLARFTATLAALVTGFTLPAMYYCLGRVLPPVWLIHYLTRHPHRVALLLWWLLVALCSIIFATALSGDDDGDNGNSDGDESGHRGCGGECDTSSPRHHRQDTAATWSSLPRAWSSLLQRVSVPGTRRRGRTTVLRKVFHASAALIFLPPLVLVRDVSCIRVAASAAIFIFIIIECLRVAHVSTPLCRHIDRCYSRFLPQHYEQRGGGGAGGGAGSAGRLVLDHVYLLVACAAPLYLPLPAAHSTHASHLCALSGVLAVAVGDAAASVGGTMIGTRRWHSGSKKTVEGTVCGMAAQVIMWSLCCAVSAEFSFCSDWIMLPAITLTSLLETFTDQVDNLVLPPFMCSILLSYVNG